MFYFEILEPSMLLSGCAFDISIVATKNAKKFVDDSVSNLPMVRPSPPSVLPPYQNWGWTWTDL